jgi:type I restriction enzyme S subunit
MKWELKSFDEIGFIGRGKSRHRPRNAEHLYGGEYPFVQTGDIKAANFRINEYSQTYNEAGLAQSKLWKEGTLCITIAANIADTAILGIDACFPDSVIGFVPYEDKSDVRFVKYFFDIFQARMKSISTGAAQDNLSLEKLLTFKIPTPPLPTQRSIASILSAYDDLIENNLKRIKLLEEKASLMYKLMRKEQNEKN